MKKWQHGNRVGVVCYYIQDGNVWVIFNSLIILVANFPISDVCGGPGYTSGSTTTWTMLTAKIATLE